MSSAASGETTRETAWEGPRLDATAVERALLRLRREGEGDGSFPIRTSVLTIVAVAQDDGDQAAIDTALAELGTLHPSRVIVVRANPRSAEDLVAARLQLHLHGDAAKGQPRLFEEQIDLEVRGTPSAYLRSVVEPLLLPDVRVLLWWYGGPARGETFVDLAALAGKVVVDSIEWDRPDAAERFLARAGFYVGDLAWDRLSIFRSRIADVFDAPSRRPFLHRLRRVEMASAGAGDPWSYPSHGLLLCGWLAAALGQDDFAAELTPTRRGSREAFTAVTLDCETDDGRRGRVSLRRDASLETATVETRFDGEDETTTDVGFAPLTLGQCLAIQLRAPERDETYERSIAAAGRLAARRAER